MYTGSTEKSKGEKKEKDVSFKVVNGQMQMYEGKNYFLYIDNYYTSQKLLVEMLLKGVYCIGTIRSKHIDFPKDLVPSSKAIAIGSYRFAVAHTQNLTAVWWRDRRDVYAMSTLHKKTVITVLKRPKGSKEKQNMPCPQMITDYTYHMGH